MTRYIDAGGALRRVLLVGLGLGMLMAVSLTFTGLALGADPSQKKDFFGAVVSVGPDSVVVSTDSGEVGVPTSAETEVRLPGYEDPQVGDLMAGDFVAVSMEEEDGVLIADTIQVIPGKTRFRHVPGQVVELTEASIEVQPPRRDAAPITLTYTLDTPVEVRGGAEELSEGSFVVVLVTRDPATGELRPQARAITVVRGPRRGRNGPEGAPGKTKPEGEEEPRNQAEIRGPFQGVDEDGNWVVGGTPVALDADTKIEGGVAAGQFVEVTAAVQADGSFLALEVEPEERGGQVARVTRIVGVFQGQDAEGNWIINGNPVLVDDRSDTDGLPQEGQRVKVKAVLQDDSTLLAREIENRGGAVPEAEEGAKRVEISGAFRGVDPKTGEWIINGARVAMDRLTELKGTPKVGGPLEVKAVQRQNGRLVAVEVEGRGKPERKGGKSAEFRGVIDEVVTADGVTTLVVDGISVALSPLTEIDGEPRAGRRVKLEAAILPDGSFRAREVETRGREADAEEEEEEELDDNKVEIEGTIERVNQDGSFVVNGITVATSALSEVKGRVAEGAAVKVEGILTPGGTVVAREMKGEGGRASASRTEAKLEGKVDSVDRDDEGNVLGLEVNGRKVALEALSELEGKLRVGARVEVKGVIVDGSLLASKVEAAEGEEEAEDRGPERGRGKGPRDSGVGAVHIEGPMESLQTDDQGVITGITINGVQIAVNASTRVKGGLTESAIAEVKGSLEGEVIVARKIEVEEEGSEEGAEPEEFELSGPATAVEKDEGNLTSVTVDGQTIVIDPLTEVEGEVGEGTPVHIEGSIIDGSYVASEVKAETAETEESGQVAQEEQEEESGESAQGPPEQAGEGEEEQDESEGSEEQDEEGVTGS